MTTYSVADAKSSLPRLIDRARGGEEVIISRHGKPVAELRPLGHTAPQGSRASYEWLKARRNSRRSLTVTSVELLDQLYDDPQT